MTLGSDSFPFQQMGELAENVRFVELLLLSRFFFFFCCCFHSLQSFLVVITKKTPELNQNNNDKSKNKDLNPHQHNSDLLG